MSASLVNTCSRPVELHLTNGVVVVPAMSRIDCAPEDLDLAQVRALSRSGVLVAHPERPPPPSAVEESAPAGKRAPAKKAATAKKAPAKSAGSATKAASSRQSTTRTRNS
jgi:hypothetical protein